MCVRACVCVYMRAKECSRTPPTHFFSLFKCTLQMSAGSPASDREERGRGVIVDEEEKRKRGEGRGGRNTKRNPWPSVSSLYGKFQGGGGGGGAEAG